MRKSSLTIITALILTAAMAVCFCGCGSEGSTEETVEITEASQEATEAAEEEEATEAPPAETPDGEPIEYTEPDYEKIYEDYKAKMSAAKDGYVKELEDQSDSIGSKDKFYDLTQDKVKALEKIYKEGTGKMVDAVLASNADDQKTYEKWYAKLTQKYTDYTREITEVYMDSF